MPRKPRTKTNATGAFIKANALAIKLDEGSENYLISGSY